MEVEYLSLHKGIFRRIHLQETESSDDVIQQDIR